MPSLGRVRFSPATGLETSVAVGGGGGTVGAGVSVGKGVGGTGVAGCTVGGIAVGEGGGTVSIGVSVGKGVGGTVGGGIISVSTDGITATIDVAVSGIGVSAPPMLLIRGAAKTMIVTRTAMMLAIFSMVSSVSLPRMFFLLKYQKLIATNISNRAIPTVTIVVE